MAKASVKPFLSILRENAIHIRLKADVKFGGAIDIASLVKALSAIKFSFSSYCEAEAKHILDRPITNAMRRELSRLADETELLIVDLNFSSFSAALSPNIVTLNNPYLSIPNPINIKKQVFEDYKKEVIYSDYSNEKFQSDMQQKFTIEERIDIYRPIYDALVKPTKFKFYVGKSSETATRVLRGATSTNIEKIAPKLHEVPSMDERNYHFYVRTDSDVDLFGPKPRVKKILAAQEMKYEDYPYQMKEITWDGMNISLKKTISADVSFDEESKVYRILFPPLNIFVWGMTRREAEDAFNMAFVSLVRNFLNESDSNLTDKAILVKQELVRLVGSST